MKVGTHPSYKERKKDGVKVQTRKKEKKTQSQGILSVLSMLGKQVRNNSGSYSYCKPERQIACVLLWEHPQRLGVYLLLAHGTQRQSHHKVVSRPTPKSNKGIPNGASFDTTVTIELRFALLNVKCFSDFSLPLPACTIYCLHALPIDFMWHRLFMDMLSNG